MPSHDGIQCQICDRSPGRGAGILVCFGNRRDRIVIISHGRVIVEGTPEALKAGLAGDSVSIELAGRPSAQHVLATGRGFTARNVTVDGPLLRAHVDHGNRALPAILTGLQAAGFDIESASVTRPSLDDVYLHYTGRSFAVEEHPAVPG